MQFKIQGHIISQNEWEKKRMYNFKSTSKKKIKSGLFSCTELMVWKL